MDEQLHEKLKARAAAEGRSVNSLVNGILSEALLGDDERARIDARIDALGLRVVPPQPKGRVPSLEEVLAMNKGSGPALSEALDADRSGR